MNLRWRGFERRTRRLALREVKASRELKAKRRGARKSALAKVPSWFFNIMLIGWAAGFIASHSEAQTNSGMTLVMAWSAPFCCLIAAKWWSLASGAAQPTWHSLPISRENVFLAHLRKFAWRLPTSAALIGAVTWALNFKGELSSSEALAYGVLLFAASVIGGLHLAAALPGPALWYIGVLLVAALIGVMTYTAGVAFLYHSHRWLVAGTPAGWVYAFITGAGASDWPFAVALALFVSAAPASFRRLRRRFVDDKIWAADIGEECESSETEDASPKRGPAELNDAVMAGELRGEPTQTAGWIERFVSKLWTDDERLAATVLYHRGPDWTASLKTAAKLLAFCFVVATIFRSKFSGEWIGFWWGLAGGAFFTMGAAPLFVAAPGLGAHQAGGMVSPSHAGFPLAYNPMYGGMIKANWVRALGWAPLYLIYAAALGWLLEGAPVKGALAALKLVLILVAIQPVVIAAWLSSSTSIKHRWSIPVIPLALAMVALIVILLFGESFRFTPLSWRLQGGILLALAAIAKTLQLLHRFLYRGRAIDLMAPASEN